MAERSKITKTFQMAGVQLQWGSIEVLPNGNVIIPHYNLARVIEYNRTAPRST